VGAGGAKDRAHSSRARGHTSVAHRACTAATAALYLGAAPAGCVGVGIDIDIDRHEVMWVCGYWMLNLLFSALPPSPSPCARMAYSGCLPILRVVKGGSMSS
jgi:hypothetical protein